MAIQAQLYSDQNLAFAFGTSQDSLMDNARAFNFIPQLPQQHFVNLLENLKYTYKQSVSSNHSISTYFEKQRSEIDQFIGSQNERLRMALQEQRKQQMAVLFKKYEWMTRLLLRQKQEEITKAANRTRELEQFLKRLETERQTWQRAARENEEMAASLNSEIERLRESANAADDAASCCENREEEVLTTEEEWEQRTMKMACRWCNSRESCVIMLPCRHMSSCKECEPFLNSCPLCTMVKKATIDVLI